MSEGRPFRVALTFDAEHPDRPRCRPGVQEEIVNLLYQLEVRGTFFLQGRWVEAYPKTAKRIAADGHRVGNHSHYHAQMPLLSNEGIRSDVTDAHEAILRITGADPRPWFRCPFGEGSEDERVLSALSALGYRNAHWGTEAFDWKPERTAERIEREIVGGALAHGDGAVLLLHTWPEPTLEAVP